MTPTELVTDDSADASQLVISVSGLSRERRGERREVSTVKESSEPSTYFVLLCLG